MLKKVLITGTSSGIGYGLAAELCKQGTQVVGISRRNCDLSDQFSNYTHYSADLNNYSLIPQLMSDIFSDIPAFDLVILNAGILGKISEFHEQSLEHSIGVMNVNVWSNKALIDQFLFNKIKVKQYVGISSGAARNGSAGWGSYSVSKAALNMLIQTYAVENSNAHFSTLAPGLVDTAMQDYISSIPQNDNMPSIEKLQQAKGTADMPNPIDAGAMLLEAMDEALSYPSGTFLDVRTM